MKQAEAVFGQDVYVGHDEPDLVTGDLIDVTATVRRTPKRSMKAAAKGAVTNTRSGVAKRDAAAAQAQARRRDHQALEAEHLLLAMLEAEAFLEACLDGERPRARRVRGRPRHLLARREEPL